MSEGNKYQKLSDSKEGRKRRQSKRYQQLTAMAKLAGWDSWSEFETALKNGAVEFPRKPLQA